MVAIENVASKIKSTVTTKFGKKISLWHVLTGCCAKKVWCNILTVANQITA